MNHITCPGCKTVLPHTDYPASNPYGVTSAECRQKFDEILVREGELFGYPSAHRLIIDAYAVQHPPVPDVQKNLGILPRFVEASYQSICIHLIALYLALEKNTALPSISSLMDRVLTAMNHQNKSFERLTPPDNLGDFYAKDMHELFYNEIRMSLEQYEKLAYKWATASWQAWAKDHTKVQGWCATFL